MSCCDWYYVHILLLSPECNHNIVLFNSKITPPDNNSIVLWRLRAWLVSLPVDAIALWPEPPSPPPLLPAGRSRAGRSRSARPSVPFDSVEMIKWISFYSSCLDMSVCDIMMCARRSERKSIKRGLSEASASSHVRSMLCKHDGLIVTTHFMRFVSLEYDNMEKRRLCTLVIMRSFACVAHLMLITSSASCFERR